MRQALALVAGMAVAAALAAWAPPAGAGQPLLQDGKSRLFERVLLRRDLPRRNAIGGEAGPEAAPALTPYFVFERAQGPGGDWLKLAAGEQGEDAFWAPAAEATSWRQTLVMQFTTLGDFDPLLFFENQDRLYDVVESEDPAHDAGELRAAAAAARAAGRPAEGDVVALGPELGVDLSQHFYLIPILSSEEAIFETGGGLTNLLEVAVLRSDARDGPPPQPPGGEAPARTEREDLEDFRIGVVFVVDTTRSMGRYFAPVRDAVGAIQRRLARTDVEDRLSFGLVGYRDAVLDDTGYLAEVFAPLGAGATGPSFMDGLAAMQEATRSTKGFREDSYAGVLKAVEALDWSGIGAGFIVLITDAGPRGPGDALSSTGMSARRLADLAKQSRNLHVAALHLKTPAGKADHASAESAYRELSAVGVSDPLYFEVEGGDPRLLETTAMYLSDSLATAIEQAGAGVRVDPEGYSPPGEATPEQRRFVERTLRVARSLQLDYLGARAGQTAPDVFEAWIADRDFRNPGAKPVEVRLLVTRRQLSDLEESLQVVIDQGESSLLEPGEFFGRVVSMAARMSRRPDQVARVAEGATLADAALVSEMLEGLPYRSQIMNLTEDDWLRMSISEQQELIDLFYEKVERYRQASRVVENWVRLSEEHGADDAVFPMSLDDLP